VFKTLHTAEDSCIYCQFSGQIILHSEGRRICNYQFVNFNVKKDSKGKIVLKLHLEGKSWRETGGIIRRAHSSEQRVQTQRSPPNSINKKGKRQYLWCKTIPNWLLENAIVEYLDYQIPSTQQAVKRRWHAPPTRDLNIWLYRRYTDVSAMGVRVGVPIFFWTNR